METASARAALDAHAELHSALNHSSAPLLRSVDHYVTSGQKFAEEKRQDGYAGLSTVEVALMRSWDYYVWPARTGLELLRLLAEPLSSAPTYQVTGEIVRAVTGMYQATGDGEPVLRASEMPSPAGFAYLDESVTLAGFENTLIANRAFSWGPQTFSPDGIRPAKGTRITSWAEGYLHALRSDAGLGQSSSVFVPYGSPIKSNITDDPTRWLHCLWLFMDTEITVTARERAGRGSRRRAERAGLRHSDINVVMLPYRHYEGGGGHREVDWSCRWIVQGHDRHLDDYREAGHEAHHAKPPAAKKPCAVCGIKTTHVRSYVKGPEGLPLKSAEKVFRVA
jgi:hypothetical protein